MFGQSQTLIVQDLSTSHSVPLILTGHSTVESEIRTALSVGKYESVVLYTKEQGFLDEGTMQCNSGTKHIYVTRREDSEQRMDISSSRVDTLVDSIKPQVEKRALAFAKGIKARNQDLRIVKQSAPITFP